MRLNLSYQEDQRKGFFFCLKGKGENIGGYFRQLEQICLKQGSSTGYDFSLVRRVWQYLETFFFKIF